MVVNIDNRMCCIWHTCIPIVVINRRLVSGRLSI